jgi:hypothetical protein
MAITSEELLEVFAAYNLQIWPMQILAYLMGVVACYFAFRKGRLSQRVVPGILAFFWLWVAFLFWLPSSLQGFTIGYLFTAMFAIEGVLFLIQAVKPQLAFGIYRKSHTILGMVFMLYALLGYPLIGLLIGHRYPRTPAFGLTPCPLIIYTFGLLLLTRSKVPKRLLVIPFFYSLSGVVWISIGIWEDVGLVLSSLASVYLIWQRDRKPYETLPFDDSTPQNRNWSLDLGDPTDKE